MILLFVVIYFGVNIVVIAVDFALMFLDWFSCWLFFAIAGCCFCVVGLRGIVFWLWCVVCLSVFYCLLAAVGGCRCLVLLLRFMF